MTASRVTKLLFVILIVMIVILPMGTVLAIPPAHSVDEFFLEGEVIADCGDFNILADSNYKITSTDYYDKDGNLTVIREHWSITNGHLYNSAHPEISLPEGPDIIMFTIDPETGISAVSGLGLHLNVPGYGIVALDAGRAILNPDFSVIWARGPHMFFEGELEPLCEFMATGP